MGTIIAFGVIILSLIGITIYFYNIGKSTGKNEKTERDLEAVNSVLLKQADAVSRSPRTKDDLIEEIKKEGI